MPTKTTGVDADIPMTNAQSSHNIGTTPHTEDDDSDSDSDYEDDNGSDDDYEYDPPRLVRDDEDSSDDETDDESEETLVEDVTEEEGCQVQDERRGHTLEPRRPHK